jgi:predicted choloylglycine hydrolase
MNRFQKIMAAAALTFLVLPPAAVQAASPRVRETVIAGSPEHFMEVRHVVLKGSDFEIGKQMATVAMREGIKARKSSNRLLSRSKRMYFARNYPAYFERMKGTAAAFGLAFEDDQYDFSGLWQSFMPGPACSAVFYPGSTTENGHSLLSRNYDFITGTLRGTAPKPGEMAVMARPYLIEMHPNKGYASLAMSAFDILGGVLDGVNSEGLTVSILDDGTAEAVGREAGDEVGFHEIQCVRYVLDNCKSAEEAKAALLLMKHYYTLTPCHYIVGDRFGRSFVFAFSPIRNRSLITEGKGPQYLTNSPHRKAGEGTRMERGTLPEAGGGHSRQDEIQSRGHWRDQRGCGHSAGSSPARSEPDSVVRVIRLRRAQSEHPLLPRRETGSGRSEEGDLQLFRTQGVRPENAKQVKPGPLGQGDAIEGISRPWAGS